jgi:hypothetical protein
MYDKCTAYRMRFFVTFLGQNTKDTEELKLYDFSGLYKKIYLKYYTDSYGR